MTAVQDATNASSSARSWREVWQAPVLLLGFGLFALGLWAIGPEEKKSDYDGALAEIAAYQRAGNLDAARKRLEVIDEFMAEAPVDRLAYFKLLNGDQVYLEQRVNDWNDVRNHQVTLDLYQEARSAGQPFDNTHIRRWAETLVALGKDEAALSKINELDRDQTSARLRIMREIIERRLSRTPPPKLGDLEALISQYLAELMDETNPQRRRDGEIWAVTLKGQLLLDDARADHLIGFLNMKYAKLQRADDADLAPLRVLLAKAYQQIGRLDDAERWYLEAQQNIGNRRDNPLNTDIYVGLGQIELARAEAAQSPAVSRAINYFNYAIKHYPGTPPHAQALIGRADCHGRLGNHAEAREDFAGVVALLNDQRHPSPAVIEEVVETVLAHHGLAMDRQDHDLALKYLETMRPLFDGELPRSLLAKLAVTHGQIGQQRIEKLEEAIDVGQSGGEESAETYRAAKIEAAVHFERSGDYYYEYAKASTVPDPEGRLDTLWRSAQQYDKARRWEKSIRVYNEFYDTTDSDPRRLEAQRKLGLAYMASNDFNAAAGLFEALVEYHPRSPQTYAALAPFARTLRALERFDEAERILKFVVTDHPAISPQSSHFREALIDLGDLYYKQGKFEEAIVTLDMAVKRYGEEKQIGPTLKYRLGDSYRKAVMDIDETLKEPMADAQRAELLAQRAEWLMRGQVLFGHVVDELKRRGPKLMSDVEQVYYRNAYFYRADCAYDLGRYEEAIALYDAAAKAFERHPSSLVAIVQIVNANCELGRVQQARIANEKARHFLKRIPEDAFNDPTLPMSRKHWEEWLRWSSELNLFGPQTSAASP